MRSASGSTSDDQVIGPLARGALLDTAGMPKEYGHAALTVNFSFVSEPILAVTGCEYRRV